MAERRENEEQSSTGHNWDGITELDNPPPRWWLNALYLSGLFVLLYFILYPALPLVNDSNKGLLGWTQIDEYKQALAELEEKRAPYEAQLAQMTVQEILADTELKHYVMVSSQVLYGDNCAGCHGIGGQPPAGSFYPVLADDEWLYGGTIDDIMMSIAGGRIGQMPAHAEDLTSEQVDGLAQFVVDSANGVENKPGMRLYQEHGCASCHGDQAQGDPTAGAPDLTDKIWRFSSDIEQVRKIILHGVNDDLDPQTQPALMPQWNERLAAVLQIQADVKQADENIEEIDWEQELSGQETQRLSESDIRKLSIYVHQMGGGQ